MNVSDILFGVVLLFIGTVGVVKGIRILFFKKKDLLPGYDVLLWMRKKRISEGDYQKELLHYHDKIMKRTALLYVIIMPIAIFFYGRMVIDWFSTL